MAQFCAVCRHSFRAFLGSIAVLIGGFGIPLDLAGQVARTVVIKGVVVDEAGMPVMNSRVALHPPNGRRIEAAALEGEFMLDAPAMVNEMVLTARNEMGELQGMAMIRVREDGTVRVTLRKAKKLVVTVMDPANQPISGARVTADVGDGLIQKGTVAEELTNDKGEAVLRFPAEADLKNLVAIKRDVGVNYKALTAGPAEPQSLVLGNNSTIAMRAIDDEGQPLKSVLIRPMSLGRPYFSVRELEELYVVTDTNGAATLRMLPATATERVSFDVVHTGYAVIQPIRFDPVAESKELVARLAPLVTLRGKVTGADGKPPAARTEIHAAGAGHQPPTPSGTFSSGWRAGETGLGFRVACDENGAFELSVARNHYYALLAWSSPQQARKGNVVSPIQMRVVADQSPAEDLSFTLGPGTRIHGEAKRVINNQSNVLANSPMEVVWRDRESYAKLAMGERLPKAEGKTTEIAPALIQNVWTDQAGRFEFYVPPGSYMLASKYFGEAKKIEVTDQAEIKADVEASGINPGMARAGANPQPQPFRPAQPVRQPEAAKNVIELAGRVVLAADREHGIGNVSVRRIDVGTQLGRARPGTSSFVATTDPDGMFKMARVEGESILICCTADGLLSSIIKIPATAKEATILLAPSATVRGRVIDAQTKKPIVGQTIDTSIRTDQTFSTSLEPYAITDARGEFLLTGLTSGWPIKLQLLTSPATAAAGGANTMRWTTLQTVTADRSGIVDVGDLPARMLEPTMDQLIAHVTRGPRGQIGRLELELGRAELLERSVLLFAAESGSDTCRQFMKMWYGMDEQGSEVARDGGLSILADQFVLLAVDTAPVNPAANPLQKVVRQGNQTVLNRLNLAMPGDGNAVVAILRPDGEVLTKATGGELSSNGQLDAEKVGAFLRGQAPKLPDAERLLDGALAQAKRDGKRVLIFQSVPLSAPSALMSLWFESQSELLAKDFVCVTLAERFIGGANAIKRVGGEASPKPCLGILDESGKRLAESKYDTRAADADASPLFTGLVEQMLTATRRTLTTDEIRTIVQSLWVP